MLSLLFRRIALTGLLLTAFVGTGMLFGALPRATAFGTVSDSVDLSRNLIEDVANVVESTDIPAKPKQTRKGPDLSWPFFSFSRKGGR